MALVGKELAARVVDSVSLLLSYIGTDLRYRYVNAHYARWFDRPREELEGQLVSSIIGPENFALAKSRLDTALAGVSVAFTQTFETVKGPRVLEVSFTPDVDEGGAVVGIIGSIQDISERHQRELALEIAHRTKASNRAEELAKALAAQQKMASSFQSLIESSVDCMIVNRDGKIVYLNAATVTCLGFDSPDDLLGKPIDSIIPEDLRPRILSLHAQLEKTGRTPISQGRLLRRDGSEFEVEVLAIPIVFDGESAVLTVARDFRERAELLSGLMQMDRMISMGTLAAGVGHEINNPLTFVLGNLDFVQQELNKLIAARPAIENDFSEVREALDEAHTGASRAAAVVAELRSLTRVSDTEPKPIHIASLLRTATRMTGNELRHRAELVVDVVDDEKLPLVQAVESRLSQVFLNLLLNAAQAIDVGNADQDRVTLRTRVEPEHVVIEIEDTGHGIPAETMSRIFEPFFTTKAVGSGTGLGLSICREIVREHEGTIEVSSVVGRGTTFTVRLPRAEAAAVEIAVEEPSEAPSGRAMVLVVDDESMVVRTLARMLSGDNDVDTTLEASDALEGIRAGKRYDVIFCDLMLPGMTGMEFYAHLQQEFPDQAERIIFMTGGAFSDDARAFAEEVSSRCERKPIRLERLEALVAASIAP